MSILPQKLYDKAPDFQLNEGSRYEAVVHTDKGEFTIELLANKAPLTVNNFVFLARDGYYDGVIFHRVIKEFMIQGGDPTGTGRGGPGYRFRDELPPALSYEPGVVAMANAGPNTNGSQFFICTGEMSKNLNRSPYYSVFGRVSAGMDTVMDIASQPVEQSDMGEVSRPVDPVHIERIEIIEYSA
ncbi:peptidyl-prolyl cis-trans isomerase cyclophilin type [Alicyclobacillus hesperidum URH17-3-68]|uniref:peptidylprolyl isomerase n=1 Tax=Alicyclobacillus hesperidum TaxID=89784 RepID=UPI000281B2C7|nr:peptidyl-prolyl cis-trans isomerase cyclophilin type [Alicyclobacillus hesperidum URH17-3-68]